MRSSRNRALARPPQRVRRRGLLSPAPPTTNRSREVRFALRVATNPELIPRLLALWAILLPIQLGTETGLRIAPSDIVLLAVLALTAGELRFRSFGPWTRWPFYLAGVILASTAWMAAEGQLTRWGLVNKTIGILVLLGAYVAVTSLVEDRAEIMRLIRAFVKSVVIMNAVFVAMYAANIGLEVIGFAGRLRGLLIDPNAYGGLLVVALALAAMSPRTTLESKWLMRLAAVSMPVGILLTNSRSAWIGLALALVGVLWFRPTTFFRYAAIGAGTGAAFLLWQGSEFTERFLRLASRSNTVGARFEIIDRSIEYFLESPVFGSGIGSFQEEFGVIVHSTPLWFLAEFGVIGLLVFVGFSIWVTRMAWWLLTHTEGDTLLVAGGLAIGHLVMLGFSLGIEALYQRHWWLIISLITVCYSIERREAPPEPRGIQEAVRWRRLRREQPTRWFDR